MQHRAVTTASCLITNWRFKAPLRESPEPPAQADNGRKAHLVDYLFDFLRGPSQHDRPASHPSPAPVVSRDGFQSSSEGVSDEQRWLRLRSLPRGACPLLLRSRLLAFLCCASLLKLFASATFWKRGKISEMREALP
jgi:hypothetical protein